MHWILSGRLRVERIEIAIADLPPHLEQTKIIHLTDLHYDGFRLSDAMLAQAITLSNSEDPDLVVLTGDYITDEPDPVHDLVPRLKYLESRLGVYACLGNHDICYPHAKRIVTEAFEGVGIKVLWNAIAHPFGEEFPVVGLADYWSRDFKPSLVFNQLDEKTPRLVLSHNPETAATLKQFRVDLQLSGHTHGGQFVIPGLGAVPTLLQPLRQRTPLRFQRFIPFRRECDRVMKNWQWAKGYHQIGDNQMYVNRGLGTYAPGRLFCSPEVTVITLVGKR
jgi:predicted MPP superfamily phosphohydrolase